MACLQLPTARFTGSFFTRKGAFMEQKIDGLDPSFFDKAIQVFRNLESESKAVIIEAATFQIANYNPCLEKLIKHHYNPTRYSRNAEEILKFLKQKLT